MKLFFEGQSIVEQIRTSIALHNRNTKTPLTDVFLNPVEVACLQRELGIDNILELEDGVKTLYEEFKDVKFHLYNFMF